MPVNFYYFLGNKTSMSYRGWDYEKLKNFLDEADGSLNC